MKASRLAKTPAKAVPIDKLSALAALAVVFAGADVVLDALSVGLEAVEFDPCTPVVCEAADVVVIARVELALVAGIDAVLASTVVALWVTDTGATLLVAMTFCLPSALPMTCPPLTLMLCMEPELSPYS